MQARRLHHNPAAGRMAGTAAGGQTWRELRGPPRRPPDIPGRPARPIPLAPPTAAPPIVAAGPPDAALIAAALDPAATLPDRKAAFGALVDRHADRLHDTLTKLLGDRHDAADAAQEAFVKAWRKLDTFRAESSFRTWLTRIALNAAASRRRTAARRGTRTGLPEAPAVDPRAAAPDAAALSDERAGAVRAALAGLAEEFRAVVVLKEFDGLAYEEIAEVVGVPVGTVRSRLHRGREQLRRSLAPLLSETPRPAPPRSSRSEPNRPDAAPAGVPR